MSLVQKIDALLPQTQCQRCGFEDCHAYAQAIADGQADINRCTPGGEQTVAKLAWLTGQAQKPVNPQLASAWPPKVAFIREDECIGCTRCIQACPTDAIIGAAKQMHTVIADECTGCELCVAACPVDCIDMPLATPHTGQPAWPPRTQLDQWRADEARENHQNRNLRLHKIRRYKRTGHSVTRTESAQHKDTIAAAMARARAKRSKINE